MKLLFSCTMSAARGNSTHENYNSFDLILQRRSSVYLNSVKAYEK